MSTIDAEQTLVTVPIPGSHPFALTRDVGWVRSVWGEHGPATHRAHLADALAACMHDNDARARIVDSHLALTQDLVAGALLSAGREAVPTSTVARLIGDLGECARLLDTHGVAERAGIMFKTVHSFFHSGHLVQPAFRWGRQHGEAKSIWTVGQIDRWLANRPGAGRPATHDEFGTPYPPRKP